MTPDCSPEALCAVLGADAYAACVQAALDAPPPSEPIKQRVRELFGPAIQHLARADQPGPAFVGARAA